MAAVSPSLRIADGGAVLTLDYAGVLAFHAGESWLGVAVAFRMLQAVGAALSMQRLWDRDDLSIVSDHPGAGVRDAIDYVTNCVSRGRYRVEGVDGETGCGRGMRFHWQVSDRSRNAIVRLRDGFVPPLLYELLDRCRTPAEQADDAARLVALKRQLARQAWERPLAELFLVEVVLTDARETVHA